MIKVVIVEDEELVRRGIVLTIDWAALDCAVVGEAANGLEGRELISRQRPDLVITDVKMPQMDGVEMIATLKEEGCAAQFIILTAYSDFTYAQNALRLGVADYLLKPFKDGELEEAVKKIREKLERREGPEVDSLPAFRFDPHRGSLSKYVENSIAYIRENYGDPAVSVSSAAEFLGISEGYLSRIFKKETAYTFNSYLTHYRIHMAMTLLKDYQIKVYQVADQVGYLDTAYFSTLFKRLCGMTPSEYQDRV